MEWGSYSIIPHSLTVGGLCREGHPSHILTDTLNNKKMKTYRVVETKPATILCVYTVTANDENEVISVVLNDTELQPDDVIITEDGDSQFEVDEIKPN